MSEVIDMFGLTKEETCLLFSMQGYLIIKNIIDEKNAEKKAKKDQWRVEWQKNVEAMLQGIGEGEEKEYNSLFNLYQLKVPAKTVMDKTGSPITKFLILLELATFIPYYSFLPEHKEKYKKIVGSNKVNKLDLIMLAQYLNLHPQYVDKFIDCYKKAIKGITGGRLVYILGGAIIVAILALCASPVIAAKVAAAGLHGAAAYAAGLAALGGGAIAAGGFGMAGGMAVIVGGGAILGGTVGGGIGAVFASSPDFALTQAAKLEVIFKEVILLTQKDVRTGQEILKKQRASIMELENQLSVMKLRAESRNDEIESMKKAIKYLREALERNEKAMA